MEFSGLTPHGLPEPSGPAEDAGGGGDRHVPAPVAEDLEQHRLGSPDDDPHTTRWTAGPSLPTSRSDDKTSENDGDDDGRIGVDRTGHEAGSRPRLELVHSDVTEAGRVRLTTAAPPRIRWTPASAGTDDPLRDAAPGLPAPTAIPGSLPQFGQDTDGAQRTDGAQPSDGIQAPDSTVAPEVPETPAELLTPPDFVTTTGADDPEPVIVGSIEDYFPLPDGAGEEFEDPGPSGPFGGTAARDYRDAIARRIPRAIRGLMPAPALGPDAARQTFVLESGRRKSDLELQLQADRLGRQSVAVEANATDFRQRAAAARDKAYEARATWQSTSHRRAALAEELQQITGDANAVATEQRQLSEQARQAMQDAAAWEAWVAQQADGGQADQGREQVAKLRDWLERAEQRFRQLGAHLDTLASRRDERMAASAGLVTEQQGLVDQYRRFGTQAQRLEQAATVKALESVRLRLDARERLIDLAGLRPDLSRWVNGPRVALVREGGQHHGDVEQAERRYEVPPGSRRPLLSEHRALEHAVPRDGAGFAAAPGSMSAWLPRVNGIGPRLDQSRAQNCVDAVLALHDIYVRRSPRVAVPRSVDVHRNGSTRLPLRGEPLGRNRLEDALGGNLQILFAQAGAAQTKFESYQVRAAFDTIVDQLKQAGHGAFAALVTGWQDGDARTSAVVNHEGAVGWVDPQLGVAGDAPVPPEWVRSVEVVMVDGEGRPVPLPGMPLSPWTTRTASAAYASAADGPSPSGSTESDPAAPR